MSGNLHAAIPPLFTGAGFPSACRRRWHGTRETGLSLAFVTDIDIERADAHPSEAFRSPTDTNLFRVSTASKQMLAHAMLNEVFVKLGTRAEQRLGRIATLNTNLSAT